jgi:hypothetical protein
VAINGINFVVAVISRHLARRSAMLSQFEDAWRRIGEANTAMDSTKERWCEAEIHRIAGEITLMSPESDVAKAEARQSDTRPMLDRAVE